MAYDSFLEREMTHLVGDVPSFAGMLIWLHPRWVPELRSRGHPFAVDRDPWAALRPSSATRRDPSRMRQVRDNSCQCSFRRAFDGYPKGSISTRAVAGRGAAHQRIHFILLICAVVASGFAARGCSAIRTTWATVRRAPLHRLGAGRAGRAQTAMGSTFARPLAVGIVACACF
jgi:hypothetical protein